MMIFATATGRSGGLYHPFKLHLDHPYYYDMICRRTPRPGGYMVGGDTGAMKKRLGTNNTRRRVLF